MSNSVNLSLDVTKTGIQNPLIKVRQGDGGFETLRTTVTANGEPMDLQGWTITFMGTTAGNHKIVDGNVTLVEAPNGIFDYTPSKAWGMDIGDFKIAYFKFVKGDGSASSANFRVNVIEAVDLTQEEAQNYISVVDATIAEVREHLESSLADVSSSVAATSVAASSMALFVSSAASSAASQANSAASNASSVASNAVSQVNSAAGTYVKKAGDTMTGNLTAPQVTASDLLSGFRNVIQVPTTTNTVIDLINNEFIKGRGFWKEATYIAFNTVLSDAPTNDAYSIIKLATRGTARTYVEYSDLSGNLWHTTATNNVLNAWVKQANDNDVVHKTGTETVAGDKTFTSPINGQLSGNATTATKWQTARTLALTGDVTGSVAMDGSGNVSMATTGANLVHKTGNEIVAGDKTFTGKVAVSGTLDAAQKVYTRTIGTTNDLQVVYTRAGNVVTGRFIAKTTGTFTLSGNDGYKSTSGYPVNVIALNVDAFFTTDNKFTTKTAGEGSFMFITSDPLPAN